MFSGFSRREKIACLIRARGTTFSPNRTGARRRLNDRFALIALMVSAVCANAGNASVTLALGVTFCLLIERLNVERPRGSEAA